MNYVAVPTALFEALLDVAREYDVLIDTTNVTDGLSDKAKAAFPDDSYPAWVQEYLDENPIYVIDEIQVVD